MHGDDSQQPDWYTLVRFLSTPPGAAYDQLFTSWAAELGAMTRSGTITLDLSRWGFVAIEIRGKRAADTFAKRFPGVKEAAAFSGYDGKTTQLLFDRPGTLTAEGQEIATGCYVRHHVVVQTPGQLRPVWHPRYPNGAPFPPAILAHLSAPPPKRDAKAEQRSQANKVPKWLNDRPVGDIPNEVQSAVITAILKAARGVVQDNGKRGLSPAQTVLLFALRANTIGKSTAVAATKAELARHAGIRAETVGRELHELVRLGVVDRNDVWSLIE